VLARGADVREHATAYARGPRSGRSRASPQLSCGFRFIWLLFGQDGELATRATTV